MPLLLLIRHATNDFVKTGRLPGHSPNIHLNDEGRAQAEALARRMKDRPLAAVYSSQLERAIETAWRVASPRGLAIQIRPALADTDTGDLTGRVVKDIADDESMKSVWNTIVENPSQGRLPNGESLLEMQARVVAELQRIVAAHADPPPEKGDDGKDKPVEPAVVAVVMHADPIKAALAHFLGLGFDNFQRLGVNPASISAVHVGEKSAFVPFVNRVPYD